MELDTSQTKPISDYLESEVQLILFTINNVEYALNIQNILEINKIQPINPLPGAPEFIQGVISLRGKIIPVVDLRERFSFATMPHTKKTRIIIANIQNSEIGLIVDAVTDVIGIHSDKIEPPLPVIDGLKIEFVEGIAKFHKRLIIIINIEKILTSSEKIILKETLHD